MNRVEVYFVTTLVTSTTTLLNDLMKTAIQILALFNFVPKPSAAAKKFPLSSNRSNSFSVSAKKPPFNNNNRRFSVPNYPSTASKPPGNNVPRNKGVSSIMYKLFNEPIRCSL